MSPGSARLDAPIIETEVLVVGAGPTGLMAAVVCASRGISVVVVDRKDGPTRESRALAVQARSMEIYDQLGLAEQVLAGANNAVRMQIGGAGGLGTGFERMQAGATRYPGIRIFEQSRNEQLLFQALRDRGGDVRWHNRLVDLVDRTDQPGGRVDALLEGADGLLRVRARWCIGADGASSTVRRELDLRFDGVTDEATFWVADIHDVTGIPNDAVAIRFGATTFAIAFPLGQPGEVRLIALAPHDAISQDEAMTAARDDLGLSFGQVEWFSTYRVHHRVASKFRVGSVFLAGDAGHVHSPVGGQGMNTGLQDAHNLGLLLADVSAGRVSPEALDRYERERRPVALLLVKVTDRAFGLIGRRNPAASFLRNHVSGIGASVLPRIARSRFGARLGGYLGQYRIRYHFVETGAPVPAWADDPAVGLRLPPVGETHLALRSLTWQLHTYGTTEVARPALPAWIEGPIAFGADRRGRLRADRLYLVRPDGFVAASIPLRGHDVDPEQLRAAVAAHLLTV
jgi:2-polyprenyl-6-methoxyphenol hydroxylase-like FAD-dependent oxidoreductase